MAYRDFIVKTFNSEIQFPAFLQTFPDINYACFSTITESGFSPLSKAYIHFLKKISLNSLPRACHDLDWTPSVGSGEQYRAKVLNGIGFWEVGVLPVCPIPRKKTVSNTNLEPESIPEVTVESMST
jgi:hypothetical protein